MKKVLLILIFCLMLFTTVACDKEEESNNNCPEAGENGGQENGGSQGESTSDVINVYFSAPSENWGETTYCYLWLNGTDGSGWPGVAMTYVETNDYGQAIYTIEVDLSSYDMVIFNNGNGWQTADTSLSSAFDGIGFYIDNYESGVCGTYDYFGN